MNALPCLVFLFYSPNFFFVFIHKSVAHPSTSTSIYIYLYLCVSHFSFLISPSLIWMDGIKIYSTYTLSHLEFLISSSNLDIYIFHRGEELVIFGVEWSGVEQSRVEQSRFSFDVLF